jgi:DNA end-binding protein Ku
MAAPRPIWRGHLRLALVTCPVALFNAKHERNAIRFNLINPKTGNRIRMVTLDGETNEELARRDLVKGYEFQKDRYLLLSDVDLDSVKVESSSLMMVEKFVEAETIDPIFYDTAYYLAPDGEAGRDVYQVLREAIRRTGRVALSRIVIGQRERTVAIRPYSAGLAVHTLNQQSDLNDSKVLFGGPEAIDDDMVNLAVQLVERQTANYDPADIEDRYEKRLREMIQAKLKGEGITEPAFAEPDRSNVVDLMAALRRSLSAPAEAAAEPQAPTKAQARGAKKPQAEGKPARKRAG